MEAYKCDRCGKLYELTPEQIKMRSRGVNYGVHNSLNSYHLDLCEKCFNELQEWVAVYLDNTSESEESNDTFDMAIEALKVYPNNEDTEEVPLKKYHVYATSEAEVTTDSEDELEISNEAYDEIIANMNFEIVREVE